jgi:hypothetical protein
MLHPIFSRGVYQADHPKSSVPTEFSVALKLLASQAYSSTSYLLHSNEGIWPQSAEQRCLQIAVLNSKSWTIDIIISCIIVVFPNLFANLGGRYAHGNGTKSIMAKYKKRLVAA